MSNQVKTYSAIISLTPHQTKTIRFPHGYFNKTPVIAITGNLNTYNVIEKVTKEYFIATNNTHRNVIYSFVAKLDRTQNFFLSDVIDTDNDGLSDLREASLGTDPNNRDTDGDNIIDSHEVNIWGTNPLSTDTDSDGLSDTFEILPQGPPFNGPGTDELNSDTDSDGLLDGEEVNTYFTNPLSFDTDGDGINDGQEILDGTDPNDPNSPGSQEVTNKSLYISLRTLGSIDSGIETISIYTGSMDMLYYPEIVNLQPDSGNNTHYEISTVDYDSLNLEPRRIKNVNSNEYLNSFDDALFKIDNIVVGQEYKIFTKTRTLSGSETLPQIEISLKSSNSNSESASEFFGDLTDADYTNITLNDIDDNLDAAHGWIHTFVVDNENNITFTVDNSTELPFIDMSVAYLNVHSNYTQNSDQSNPNIEIAIQSASYDGNDDGQGVSAAGYISPYSYTLESLSPELYEGVAVNNYTALRTVGNLDINTSNHARVSLMINARERYRVHVKVPAGSDGEFNISLRPLDMMSFMDLESYNNDFDENSQVDYINLIPSSHTGVASTYYHYFTLREDGFVIWEHNLTVND